MTSSLLTSDATAGLATDTPSPAGGPPSVRRCSTWKPVCPRCGSREAQPIHETLRGAEESFEATHECRCGMRYRVELPTQQALQSAHHLPSFWESIEITEPIR